ncbi:hypothetical protein Mapa_010214 [Marchantia paleacea]|nr:hypothetical protein Mapa_010214 [Marchantia paleacea]
MTRRWQGFGNLNCFVGDDNSPAIMPPVLMSICRSLTSCSHADSVALYRHLTVDVNLLFRSYNSAGSVLRELYYSSRRKYMVRLLRIKV